MPVSCSIRSHVYAALVLATMFIFSFSLVNASEVDPFHFDDLSTGIMVADGHGKGNKMKRMDTNADGFVSKDEFIAHAHMKFAKKDKNGDGKLSEDELKKGCKQKHGKGKHEGQHGKDKHEGH